MRLPGQLAAPRLLVLGLPLLLIAGLILGPLLITLVVSFFEKSGFWIRPAFTLDSYRLFFAGARLEVLERSFRVALRRHRAHAADRLSDRLSGHAAGARRS